MAWDYGSREKNARATEMTPRFVAYSSLLMLRKHIWHGESEAKRLTAKRKGKLAELWTSAAVNIRRSDMDLATRLEEKADYWTNPDNWTNEEVRASRIQIDEIANE